MEQSARKLIKERSQLQQQIAKIDERIKAINTALEIIELRLANDPKFTEVENSIDKNQMEYLLTVGGYCFDAKDPTNSVEVTLRRMAADGQCEVEKRGGSYGNLYRAAPANQEVKN